MQRVRGWRIQIVEAVPTPEIRVKILIQNLRICINNSAESIPMPYGSISADPAPINRAVRVLPAETLTPQ